MVHWPLQLEQVSFRWYVNKNIITKFRFNMQKFIYSHLPSATYIRTNSAFTLVFYSNWEHFVLVCRMSGGWWRIQMGPPAPPWGLTRPSGLEMAPSGIRSCSRSWSVGVTRLLWVRPISLSTRRAVGHVTRSRALITLSRHVISFRQYTQGHRLRSGWISGVISS